MLKINKIIVTGGAGFVGTNLIKLLLKKTKFKIISVDNYSTGSKQNHLKSSKVSYIRGDTSKISNPFETYFFTISGVIEILFSKSLFSDIEPMIMK